jgi:hypothetical protein
MALFRKVTDALSRAAQALECLTSSVEALREVQGDGDLKERLAALELGQQKWQAQIEASLLRAEGKFRAARAAEERARAKGKGILEDEIDPEEAANFGAPVRDPTQAPTWDAAVGNNAPPSNNEQMSLMPDGVASNRSALLAKFGMGQ